MIVDSYDRVHNYLRISFEKRAKLQIDRPIDRSGYPKHAKELAGQLIADFEHIRATKICSRNMITT